MKKLIVILFLTSCTPIEVDTITEVVETRVDTTETIQVSGVPITFDVNVENWE